MQAVRNYFSGLMSDPFSRTYALLTSNNANLLLESTVAHATCLIMTTVAIHVVRWAFVFGSELQQKSLCFTCFSNEEAMAAEQYRYLTMILLLLGEPKTNGIRIITRGNAANSEERLNISSIAIETEKSSNSIPRAFQTIGFEKEGIRSSMIEI